MTDTYQEFQEKIQGGVLVITNCMTAQGVKVVIVWTDPVTKQASMAEGENLQETMRKAVQMQEEADEARKPKSSRICGTDGHLCFDCGDRQDVRGCGKTF